MRNQHFFDTIVKNLTKLASLEKTEILRHRSRIQFTPKAVVLQYFARTYLSTRNGFQSFLKWHLHFKKKVSHLCYNNGMKNEKIYLVKKNSVQEIDLTFFRNNLDFAILTAVEALLSVKVT